MIGKIRKGVSFYGLLHYLAKNPNASRLDSSVSPAARDAAAELAAVANAGKELEKPVRHLMVRLPADEALPEYDWRYVASIVLSRLGYEDAPSVVWLHDDPDGAHVHIVTTARDFAGRYVSDSNDHHRIQVVLRELERELGLKAPTPRSPRLPQAEGPFRDLEAALSGDRLATAELVRHAAARAVNFETFAASLRELGYTVRAQWGSGARPLRGLAFTTPDGTTVKASQLDRVLRRPPLGEEFPALHLRGPRAAKDFSAAVELRPALADTVGAAIQPASAAAATRPARAAGAEKGSPDSAGTVEGRLLAVVTDALARSASFADFAKRLEDAGWSPRIVTRGSSYGIRFEESRPRGAGRSWRPYRIAGSRLAPGFGLLALSHRFPHVFAAALPSARSRAWEVDATAASRLVAFDVPASLRSRLKLDARFVAFAGSTFWASESNARALAERYGLTARPVALGERALRNPFGFSGGSAAARDLETYRSSRLRGLAHRVLATYDPQGPEAARHLARLDRFARRMTPEAPSLALQILVQMPGCPTRSYRPAAAGQADLVALAGPAAERQRARETGLVVHSQEGNLWVDRSHLPHLQRLAPALWVNYLAPRPAELPPPARGRGETLEAGASMRTTGPFGARAAERLAAREPSQVPAAWLLALRASREPAGPSAARNPAEALATFRLGDRSSLNLLALASRPVRLRFPRGQEQLATYLRAERVLTARLLREARSPRPNLERAATLAADLLGLREAVNTRLRKEAGLRQPPRPSRGQAAPISPAEALASVQSIALYSLAHLSRAAGYWTALQAEDPALAVGRLAMTGLPPFRHAARLSAALQGDDPMLSIARLYLVDGAIRAAAVLAPQPLAAVLTTVRALVSTLKTVLALAEERGRGR